ncbi:hypothetical protein DESPIG_00463 [Desulfovibrio piger ATCC 29098]|uniref:Uncharacterized protein n=1 Tax=Desulfovibrio piger ATCC 29098 TaxID=411464 RepID=B6WQY3_9BACT|nr:hypothetical protein DESPIG_00463 [Desulfovibrio piger ATCC 29098]
MPFDFLLSVTSYNNIFFKYFHHRSSWLKAGHLFPCSSSRAHPVRIDERP